VPEQSDAERFAAFLNALLDSQSLSGAQAARRLKVAQSQVSRWRRGEGGISLENLHRIHAAFGTDLEYLKRLAGFSASTPTTAEDDVYVEQVDALYDADRAELHEELRDIPQIFWTTILAAQRSARRAAIDNARRAIELISLLPRSELATLLKDARRDDDDNDRPPGKTLASYFALSFATLAVS